MHPTRSKGQYHYKSPIMFSRQQTDCGLGSCGFPQTVTACMRMLKIEWRMTHQTLLLFLFLKSKFENEN